MVVENRGDGSPEDTHDGDVVDRHAHVLGVVQGGDLGHGQVEPRSCRPPAHLNIPRLPSKKRSKYLRRK